MNQKLISRIIFLILIITNCIVIFMFSNQNGEKSSNISGNVIKKIMEILPGTKDLSENEKETLKEQLQFIVRKGAHFTIYTFLGAFSMGFINTFNLNKKRKKIFALFFGIIYALTDEFHQLFSDGRSASILDVGIDSLGVIFGILIVSLIIYVIKREKTNITN